MDAISASKKPSLLRHPAIYTDFYELTMAQGYFLSGRKDERATFDYFFRSNPFKGGYVIFAGLSDLAKVLNNFRFYEDELQFLAQQGFHEDFLSYLRNFSLSVDIYTAKEGEVVFPLTPLMRVEGSIIETQILETLILNILNFESLIATKAARMKDAAGDKKILDFGLRRAQGLGGIQASKAAYIGGVEATSNTYASFEYGIPASGTMAHSWIQSFEDELTAFRNYAKFYPDDCILLVDTYNTLSSGLTNAITVAKELEERGHRLKGIRLDSGDLAYFARKARKMLDDAGLDYVKIAASNHLDEQLIQSLLNQHAPIDLFGVGTRLVTGYETPALDGVYKLSAVNDEPKLKVSENVEKTTLPGRKKVMRYSNGEGCFYGDGILLANGDPNKTIHHPLYTSKRMDVTGFEVEPLLHQAFENGRACFEFPTPARRARQGQERLQKANPGHKP